jgi:hypothetical protein
MIESKQIRLLSAVSYLCILVLMVKPVVAQDLDRGSANLSGMNKYVALKERDYGKTDIVRRMSLDIELGDKSFLQLDPVRNSYAFSILDAQHIVSVEEAAIEPYVEKICLLMPGGNPDASVMASLFEQAKQAESIAVSDIYDSVIAELSNETLTNLDFLLDSTIGRVTELNTDWAAAANDNPDLVISIFDSICSNRTLRDTDATRANQTDEPRKISIN